MFIINLHVFNMWNALTPIFCTLHCRPYKFALKLVIDVSYVSV